MSNTSTPDSQPRVPIQQWAPRIWSTTLMFVVTLAAAVDATAWTVRIKPRTAGRAIDLGTETFNKLSLTDAELDSVTAGIVRIGNAAARRRNRASGIIGYESYHGNYCPGWYSRSVCLLSCAR